MSSFWLALHSCKSSKLVKTGLNISEEQVKEFMNKDCPYCTTKNGKWIIVKWMDKDDGFVSV